MTIKRLDDWADRLKAAIEAKAHEPHSWGDNDCALFAADVIEAMTGVDIAKDFRGKYTTEIGAARMLKKAGFSSLSELGNSMLESVPPSFARRGDIVIMPGELGDYFAVCLGHVCAGPGASGVIYDRRTLSKEAFSVPFKD
jgi:hypothetical protein